MSAPYDPASADRVAGDLACLGRPRQGGGRVEVAELVAAIARARLLLCRLDTRDGKGDVGSSMLLADLHLDLAAAELADVDGAAAADWVDGLRDREDGSAWAGLQLVQRCLRDVQDMLRRGRAADPDHVEPLESLSYTRAVLHLHAAQRAWPPAAEGGGR